MIQIKIQSPKSEFFLELNDKINVLKGVSGAHKTQMVKILEMHDAGYKVTVTKSNYRTIVLNSQNWDIIMSGIQQGVQRYICFVDDADFIEHKDFIDCISQDTKNYFVFINRVSGMLSFSVDSIYVLQRDGRKHKAIKAYSIPVVKEPSGKGILMSEDSTSGKRWWTELTGVCETSYGNPGIVEFIKQHSGQVIYMAVDLFGLGYFIDDVLYAAIENKVSLRFFNGYGSFEYLLLSSNMFKYTLTEEDILCSVSREIACEKVLDRLTRGKYYKYDKSYNLNFCYYKDCCTRSRKDKCDRGLPGNKFEAMLKGTEFEYLLSFRAKDCKSSTMLQEIANIKFD